MARLWRVLPVLMAALCAFDQASASPVQAYEFQAPRPFGLVLGDEIRHRVVVDVDSSLRLMKERLPAPGRINRWLELREIDVERHEEENLARYVLSLRYQTFHAPLTVEMLAIPGFSLVFEGGAEPFEWAVEPWHFTMSPIRELAVRKGDGGEYMRPADPPAALEKGGHLMRLLLFSLAGLGVLGAYLYIYGLLPFLARGQIFNRACRSLARLAKKPLDDEVYRSALKTVHRAFNALHGEPVFIGQLADFFRSHPGYQSAAPEVEAFFEASHGFLFAKQPSPAGEFPLQRMISLCRRLRDIERGIE